MVAAALLNIPPTFQVVTVLALLLLLLRLRGHLTQTSQQPSVRPAVSLNLTQTSQQPSARPSTYASLTQTTQQPPRAHYAFSNVPDGAGAGYSFEWEMDTQNSKFLLALSAPSSSSTGWVGWGVGEPGTAGMAGVDMVIVSKTTSGDGQWSTSVARDCYAMGDFAPITDAPGSQDWTLVSTSTLDGVDTLFLSRPLDTQDSTQDHLIDPYTDSPVPVLFASGACSGYTAYNDSSTSTSTSTSTGTGTDTDSTHASCNIGYHTFNRWQQDLRLNVDVDIAVLLETVPDLGTTADFIGDPWTLRHEKTHYVDTYFPNTLGNVTLLGVAPVVKTEETRFAVHHFMFYGENLAHGSNMWEMLFSWTRSPPLLFPNNSGIRLDSFGRFKMTTHYDNPLTNSPKEGDRQGWTKGNKGQIVTAGVKLYLTDVNVGRPLDIGMMSFGDPHLTLAVHEATRLLPQGKSSFTITCKYPKDQKPRQLFQETLHMHELGTGMFTKQIRNGKEIRDTRIEFFKFGHQNAIPLLGYEILPGDVFITKCFYDTGTSKKKRFGNGAENEMCISFTYVWPKPISRDAFVCAYDNRNTNVALKRASADDEGAVMLKSWGTENFAELPPSTESPREGPIHSGSGAIWRRPGQTTNSYSQTRVQPSDKV